MLDSNDIRNIIIDLSRSQGFYGRILAAIEESEDPAAVWDELAAQGFTDPLDVVFFFEC